MGSKRIFSAVLTFLGLSAFVAHTLPAQSGAPKSVPNTLNRNDLPPAPVFQRSFPRSHKPEIFFCETPDTSCHTTQDTFPLADLRDLYVFVMWPGITGQHMQTVEFSLPDGSIYLSRKTRFTIGTHVPTPVFATQGRKEVSPPTRASHLVADANKIHNEGIPSLLTARGGVSTVLTVLPVGGTYITQRNLSGTWHVRVFLDDRAIFASNFTLTNRAAARIVVADLDGEPR